MHDAGIVGLARAFQLAGAKDVVMSLWSVDDEATRDLMTLFMHESAANWGDPADALREAMLAVRRQHPAPAKWASFVVFGTSRQR